MLLDLEYPKIREVEVDNNNYRIHNVHIFVKQKTVIYIFNCETRSYEFSRRNIDGFCKSNTTNC
jgi:hypothetical protein